MTRMINVAAIALAVIGIASVTDIGSRAAAAPLNCPEGTKNGQCVNAGLASFMRRGAIVYTQQKLSISVPTALVLPRDDRRFPVVRDYRELNMGIFSTSPFPYSCHPNC